MEEDGKRGEEDEEPVAEGGRRGKRRRRRWCLKAFLYQNYLDSACCFLVSVILRLPEVFFIYVIAKHILHTSLLPKLNHCLAYRPLQIPHLVNIEGISRFACDGVVRS